MTDREALERALERFWINDTDSHGKLRPGGRELISVLSGIFWGGTKDGPLEDGTVVSNANRALISELHAAVNPTPLQLRTAANGPWEAEWGKGEPGDVVYVLPDQDGPWEDKP